MAEGGEKVNFCHIRMALDALSTPGPCNAEVSTQKFPGSVVVSQPGGDETYSAETSGALLCCKASLKANTEDPL